MKNKKIIGIGCLAAAGVIIIALCIYLNAPKYDSIGEYNGFGLAKAEKSDKFGYIDKDKKEIIPVLFDSVGDFTDSGMIVVTDGGREGVYRFDGTCTLPLEYQSIELGKANVDGVIPISLDGEENFMNLDGSILFEAVGEGPMSLLKVQSDDRYGFADQDGTVVLPCDYTELEVLNDNGDNALLVLDGSRNFMDAAGKMLYDEAAAEDEDGWLLVKLDGNCGYVTAANEEIIPVKYTSLEKEGRNSAGYIRLAADGGLLLTDEKGAPVYQEMRDFESNDLAAVQDQDGLWGYIDREGETAVACLYDEVEPFNEYGLSRARSGDLYGYIDGTGVQVIPCLYDELAFNEYGVVKAREGQEVTFFSPTGQKQFDKVGEFSGKGVTFAEKDNAFFFIDDTGNRISEKEYDSITELRNTGDSTVGGFLICKGIRYGLADETGQELIPAEYDEAEAEEIAEEYCLWNDLKAGLDFITAQVPGDPAPGQEFWELLEFHA